MINKLKIVLVIIISLLSFSALAVEWQQSFWYKGSWSSWQTVYNGQIKMYADESGLTLCSSGGFEYFSFHINHYVAPSKEQIKEHLKSDRPFEYTGTVEYYVSDAYPTAEAIAKANRFVIPNPRTDTAPTVKRSTSCRVVITPYKKLPSNYNISFDGITVAINIQGITFQGQKKHVRTGRVIANIAQTILLPLFGWGSWFWNPVRVEDVR